MRRRVGILVALVTLTAGAIAWASGFGPAQGGVTNSSNPSFGAVTADTLVADSLTINKANADTKLSYIGTGTLMLDDAGGSGDIGLVLGDNNSTTGLRFSQSGLTMSLRRGDGTASGARLQLYSYLQSGTGNAGLLGAASETWQWLNSSTGDVNGELSQGAAGGELRFADGAGTAVDSGLKRASAGVSEFTDGSTGAGSVLVAGESQQGDTVGTAQWFSTAGEVALTDETPVGIWQLSLPQETGAGGVVHLMVYAIDGTDVSVYASAVRWAAANKAGTITADLKEGLNPDSLALALTGTSNLSVSVTMTEPSADVIQFNVNANTNLTTTTFYCRFRVECNVTGVTPQ